MANRIPLIVDSTAKQIQELPSGDSLNGILNITATGTIQAEQLTSTDDANITDNLTVGGQLNLTGTALGSGDINFSGGSDGLAVVTNTSNSGEISFVTKNSGGTNSTVKLGYQTVNFSGGDITGTAVTFSPTGAAPIYGVRAHGLITEKSSNGTYTGNLNGGNIASYERLGTGEYKINLEHDMPNTNYTVITTPEYQDGGSDNGTNVLVRTSNKLVGSFRIVVTESQSNNDAKDQTFYIMVVG
jgi:hypothetical protein